MVSDMDWQFVVRRIEELEKKVKILEEKASISKESSDWTESLDSNQDVEE